MHCYVSNENFNWNRQYLHIKSPKSRSIIGINFVISFKQHFAHKKKFLTPGIFWQFF